MIRRTALLSIIAGTVLAGGYASAVTIHDSSSNPTVISSGSTADRLLIGLDGSNDIVVCNVNNGNSFVLEAGTTLNEQYEIRMGDGADEVYVQRAADSSRTFCSKTLSGGITVDADAILVLKGEGGNDKLATGDFRGQAIGGDGDDAVTVRTAQLAQGGDGADLVASDFSSGLEMLEGNAGADTIAQVTDHVVSSAPGYLNCGGTASGDAADDTYELDTTNSFSAGRIQNCVDDADDTDSGLADPSASFYTATTF